MDLFLYNLPHWGAFFIYHSTNSYSSGCNGGKLGIGILPNDIWHADWSRKRSNYQPFDLLDDLLYVLSHSQKIIIIGFQFINILQQTLKKKRKKKKKTCMGKWGTVVRCLHCKGNIYSKVNFLFWLIHCRLI